MVATTPTKRASCYPRGTSVFSVTALPARQELSTSTVNIIESRKDLAFGVTVTNRGCAQETKIPVTLTIPASPTPIVRRAEIDQINPGEEETVVLRDIGAVPCADRTSIRVDVEPVPGEATTKNNSVEYPAIFALGP
ncbi:MAG TPA: hypothetical protein VGQ68_04275 [Gaiellaceae bacterium]|jgi:hypothetical protein|nr:hypothetical protein [Gaiellaceae bacterium]